MVLPIDTFTAYNQAFGWSFVKTYNETAAETNIRKFFYSIPLVSIGYICLQKHYYSREITKLEITRVALSSSVVGLPFLLVTDLVSSVTTQLIFIKKTHAKRKLEEKVYS